MVSKTKAELQAEIETLKSEKQHYKDAFIASQQIGLDYKKRFQTAYNLLCSIDGINSHPKWLEVQAFIGQFRSVQHPTYGQVVLRNDPKSNL